MTTLCCLSRALVLEREHEALRLHVREAGSPRRNQACSLPASAQNDSDAVRLEFGPDNSFLNVLSLRRRCEYQKPEYA